MLKKSTLAALLATAFLITAFGHNPSESPVALCEFHLKNHRHLHASFLMMRGDSVFLEKENGTVRGFALAEFAAADQQFFKGKKAAIKRLNQQQVIQTPTSAQALKNQAVSKSEPCAWIWIVLAFAALPLAWLFQRNIKWSLVAAFGGAAVLMGFKAESIQKILGTDPLFMDAAFEPFKPHVATHWDDTWFYVESTGLPTTHLMMTGITKWQQQVPIPQCYIGANAWQIPLNPVLAAQPVPVNDQHFLRGAVAVAANGIPIFNPHTNTGVDAFLDGQLDQWGGHSGRADDYHYHIAPMFLDTQSIDILPIAFALDGFAVYAGKEPDGSSMLPLDANHGHFDAAGVYHYHGTPEAPYMIGNMVGKVTEDATLQIIPQAKAKPVRPSLTPLNGATITDFQPNGTGTGYTLTYNRNGETFQMDYSWTSTGVYTYNFISPTGTTTETYNGQAPCTEVVSTDNFSGQKISLTVFPNPVSGIIFLNFNELKNLGGGSEGMPSAQVQIFDTKGSLVFQKEKVDARLEIGDLARGVYFLKVKFEKGEISRKIIVQ